MGWLRTLLDIHARHKGGEMATPRSGVRTATDLVCGMDVEIAGAPAMTVFEGKPFYFCARSCKQAFEKDPTRYTERLEKTEGLA